jgi:hypothetical protein
MHKGKEIAIIRIAVVLFVSMSRAIAFGCATAGQETAYLLEQDFRIMGDEELLHYYDQLTDQIALVEGVATGTQVGVGYGREPFGIGIGTGVSRRAFAEDLRERRSEVRVELRERGLQP